MSPWSNFGSDQIKDLGTYMFGTADNFQVPGEKPDNLNEALRLTVSAQS